MNHKGQFICARISKSSCSSVPGVRDNGNHYRHRTGRSAQREPIPSRASAGEIAFTVAPPTIRCKEECSWLKQICQQMLVRPKQPECAFRAFRSGSNESTTIAARSADRALWTMEASDDQAATQNIRGLRKPGRSVSEEGRPPSCVRNSSCRASGGLDAIRRPPSVAWGMPRSAVFPMSMPCRKAGPSPGPSRPKWPA